MRKAHKLLSLLLVLTLALSICAPAGAAYSDTSGHWAESAIDRWTGYGIVSRDENGFNPDGNLTRGQMAKILAEALGLTKQAEQNPFADVADDAWYAPYVLRCYAAGIMMGDGANASPNASISREEAMVMLCRALGIAPASGGALESFSDAGSVSSWAAPYVAAMVQSGIVNGVGNNSIAPADNISRAALMTILDRSVVQYINEPGSYELTDKAGIVLVAAGDVTLTGETRADVLVSPAAEGKGVAFDGATVTGSVTVQAEDVKVTSVNSTLPDVSFTGEGGGEVEPVTPEPAKPATGGSSGGPGGSTPSHTHSWGEGVVTTAATCTTAGVKTFTCSCGDTKTEAIDALGHDVADVEYTSDETGHSRECTRCGEAAKEAHVYGEVTTCTEAAACTVCGYAKAAGTHIWGEGEVTTAVTCTTAGVMTYTCTSASCDTDVDTEGNQPATKTETIPAKGHTEVVDAAVDATCTETGLTEGKHCSVCDTVLVAQETVDALGHDVEGVEYSKDETGHWKACTRCGAKQEEAPHGYESGISCDAAATCTTCGYVKPGGEHAWGEGTVKKAATCSEAGEMEYTCTVCDATKTEKIEKLAHTEVVVPAKAATCTETGLTEGKRCSVCETVTVPQTEVPAKGHTEVVDAAVAATCTGTGLTAGKHCSVCNTVTVAQTEVAAKGHAYGAWTKVDDTNHKRVCANDAGHVETEAHKWSSGVESGDKITYTCTDCKATKTEDAGELKVWINAYNEHIFLEWTPKEDFTGSYLVKSDVQSNIFEGVGGYITERTSYEIEDELKSLNESGTVSYEIRTVTFSEDSNPDGEVYLTANNIANVEFEKGTPALKISGQSDGSYKFESNDGYTGMYSYELKDPKGNIICTGNVKAGGTAKVAPYTGCKFSVKKVHWQTGNKLSSITVTLSEAAEITSFAPVDFSKTTAQVSTAEAFKEAMNKGGTVTMTGDINIGSDSLMINSGGEVTLDLNGHTLTGDGWVLIRNGKTVHIVDNSEEKTGEFAGGRIHVHYGSALTCNGGEYANITSGGSDNKGKAKIREITLTDAVVHDLEISLIEKVVISDVAVYGKVPDVAGKIFFESCTSVVIEGESSFTDELEFVDCTSVIIRGGKFASDPSAYVDSENYTVTYDDSRYYTVTAKG